MSSSAKVIAHSAVQSLGKSEPELITLQVTFNRYLLPEVNTHRVFSRNYSSSRAIPTTKLLEQVRFNPAMPIHWGKNQPGMQADVELCPEEIERAKELWLKSARNAADVVEEMYVLGGHKQWVNRILEPYLHVTGIISSTEWLNWDGLRCHPAAQPEIQELGNVMKAARDASTPTYLGKHEWHLPYVSLDEQKELNSKEFSDLAQRVSAARCCRVSYLKQDGTSPSVEDDLELAERLGSARPIHASPFEHQAYPDPLAWRKDLWGNFQGWIQYRKHVESNINTDLPTFYPYDYWNK